MSAKELDRKYGPKGSKRIRTRLSQLDAVETLDDMRNVPGRCHELTGDLAGCLAVDLDHPYRLVFRPLDPVPRKPDGGLDWCAVTSIVVIAVEDYH